MNNKQKILSSLRRAIDGYNLIQEGDKIAVGVSGGKDSIVLLEALHNYSKFAPYKFKVVGITIDSFPGTDFSKIEEFCKAKEIEYHIIKSDIYEIVFNERKEKNPCSLCSKLRRGMLNTNAIELGCNKLALGHSMDDVIHTYLLSLCYEGRISTLSPLSYLDRTGITVIRPLYLTDERDIIAASHDLPIVKSKCPVDKTTKREYVKDIVKFIQQEIPFVKDRIFGAITHPERVNLPPELIEKEDYSYKKKDD
jgi:tRNA(Ile)-lysidine synthase TilS/MesJ